MPIMLTRKQVQEFQKLYKARFGKEISYEEAYEQGVQLVRLMELIYHPMTLEEWQKVQERREETGDTQERTSDY